MTRTIKTVSKELEDTDRRLQLIWQRYDQLPPGAPDNPKLDKAFDDAFLHRDRLLCELKQLQAAAPRQANLNI